MHPTAELYWDREKDKTWWDEWGRGLAIIIGIVAAAIAIGFSIATAALSCGSSVPVGVAVAAAILKTVVGIAVGTVIGAAITLAIGGIVSGYQATRTGHSFWSAFGEHVQDNILDAVVTSFMIYSYLRES